MEDAEKHIGWVVVKRDLFSDTVHRQGKEKELRSADQQIVRVGLGLGEEALGALDPLRLLQPGEVRALGHAGRVEESAHRAIDRCLVLEEYMNISWPRTRRHVPFPVERRPRTSVGAARVRRHRHALPSRTEDARLAFSTSPISSLAERPGRAACGRWSKRRVRPAVSAARVWRVHRAGATKTLHPLVRGLDPGQVWSSTSGLSTIDAACRKVCGASL